MTDREFLIQLQSQIAAQLGQVPVPPGPTPIPPGPTPPVPPGPVFNFDWNNTSQPQIAQLPSQTYMVTPSAAWLAADPKTRIMGFAGGVVGVGTMPSFVRYTFGGVSNEFGGSIQAWDTFAPDFPPVTGPFGITVAMLDADHQPVGVGFAVSVQLNHS